MTAPQLTTVRALVDHLKAQGAEFRVGAGARIRDAECNCPLAVACRPFDDFGRYVANHSAGSFAVEIFRMPIAIVRAVIDAADNMHVGTRPEVAEARRMLMELVR